MSLHQLFLEPLQFEWMIRGLIVAVLVSVSLGLVGVFLVLRRLALTGDAIAHAVLPGIVIAFLISQSRASLPLLIGASAIGFITTILINGIHLKSKVKEDAAIGIVFSTLFALGVVLLTAFASHVDLDPDCVLYGDLLGVPTATVWVMLAITAVIVAAISLFYKQLLVSAFDALFADAIGIASSRVHYVFMGLLSLVLVASFEAVGSVLVVAMLIAPGATAHLWCNRLTPTLLVASLVSILAAVTGMYVSVWINCSPAGAIVVTAFALFVLSLLVAPEHGVIARRWRTAKLQQRVLRENILKESLKLFADREAISITRLNESLKISFAHLGRALSLLGRQGHVRVEAGTLQLTESGAREGRRVLRNHRLWELFLSREFQLPEDHLHRDAEEIEHLITPELEAKLAAYLNEPTHDPHGKPIPNVESK